MPPVPVFDEGRKRTKFVPKIPIKKRRSTPSSVVDTRDRGRITDALRYTGRAISEGKMDPASSPLWQAAVAGGIVPGRPTTPQVPTMPRRPSQPGQGPARSPFSRTVPVPSGPTVGDILKNLTFPNQAQLPPFLRDVGRFFEELLTSASRIAVPVPKVENGRLVTEGSLVKTEEIPQQVEAYTQLWQNFLTLIQNATDLGLQQQLLALRFSPEVGFFLGGQSPQLPVLSEL